MTGIPFRVEGVNMFRDYLEIVGDLAVQTHFLPPLLSREEIPIWAYSQGDNVFFRIIRCLSVLVKPPKNPVGKMEEE